VVNHSVSALEREGRSCRNVTLEVNYETTPEEIWAAITDPERLQLWFLPISGDLQPGGNYQFEGNAHGTITDCEPGDFVAATWEFGDHMSWIEARIIPKGAGSTLKLSHICPVDDHWKKYGAGASGVGWDLGLFGLAVHLLGDGAERLDETL